VLTVKFEARVKGRIDIPQVERVVLDHVQLHGEDYSGRKLMQFCTIGCRLEKCRFVKVSIATKAQFGSGLEMSEFVECVFDGSRLVGLGGRSRFVRCSFRDVRGSHWIFNQAELIDCTFSGHLKKAIFSGAVPRQSRDDLGRERNEFRGNDFSAMKLIDVTFRAGIDLALQRLPSGPEYLYLADAEKVIEEARSRAASLPESESRKTALGILNNLADEVKAGQRNLFLRPADWLRLKSLSREGVETAFALLRSDLGA
jgi:hypothetical protein